MEYFNIIIIGYFIGSIPTAFILLKYKSGLDIRTTGSGNVGTLNSFEITNSKRVGLIVLTIDILKGILSVSFAKYFIGDTFEYEIISLLAAVFGHCYSIWIKFSGGRGLATFGGGLLIISPLILMIWGASWLVTHRISRNIHLGNIVATLIVILSVIIFPNELNNLSIVEAESSIIFSFYLSLLMIIILSKHIKPLIELLKSTK